MAMIVARGTWPYPNILTVNRVYSVMNLIHNITMQYYLLSQISLRVPQLSLDQDVRMLPNVHEHDDNRNTFSSSSLTSV
jgi:hypothetical protein